MPRAKPRRKILSMAMRQISNTRMNENPPLSGAMFLETLDWVFWWGRGVDYPNGDLENRLVVCIHYSKYLTFDPTTVLNIIGTLSEMTRARKGGGKKRTHSDIIFYARFWDSTGVSVDSIEKGDTSNIISEISINMISNSIMQKHIGR